MKFLQQLVSKKNAKQNSSKQVTPSPIERKPLEAAVVMLETEPPRISLENVADNLPRLDDNTLLCILQAFTSPVALTKARMTCKRLYVFGGARILWVHWAREQYRLGRSLNLPRHVLLQDASAEQLRQAVLKSHRLHKNICSQPSRILRTVNIPLERCQHVHPLYAQKWLITEHWDCVRITSIEHPDAACKIEVADILSKNVQYSENEDGSLILVMGTTTHRDQQTADERLSAYRIELPAAATNAPTSSLLLEREIKDWRQGVRAGWKLGSGLLLYHPKDAVDTFVIEDVLDDKNKQRIEIPKSQLEAFAFHQDMLFTVSAGTETEGAAAVLHIFTAHDIRKVLQATTGDQNGELGLPPEQWSRKYSALHPLVPRLFNFEFRSNEHTRSGHVVFRASGAGEGPDFYWNVGQVRWSIEKSESEFIVHAESCYELVIVAKDSGAPPTPVKFQKAEERGAIHIDKFKDSLPGCFHVLRPLVQPVDGVEIIEQCFPILLPEDLREKYVKGATICDVHFNEEEGSLLVGTMSEVWAMYYV